jgi:hypothetical protein
MWRAYFPQAKLFGLDIARSTNLEASGVTLFTGSQGDPGVLDRVVAETGKLDIVIDDGSHRWSDQIVACQRLFPHLQAGGFYAIEDLHTSYWDHYRSGQESTVAFLHALVHDLNLHGRSGYGDPRNDPQYGVLIGELNPFERMLDSITFRKSLALLRKKPAAEL